MLPRPFFSFQPPMPPPSSLQRPRKSGHSIRDILGRSSDDEADEAEKKTKQPASKSECRASRDATDLSGKPDATRAAVSCAEPGPSSKDGEEGMSVDCAPALPENAKGVKNEARSRPSDVDSDEEVNIDVEDEEQLWDWCSCWHGQAYRTRNSVRCYGRTQNRVRMAFSCSHDSISLKGVFMEDHVKFRSC